MAMMFPHLIGFITLVALLATGASSALPSAAAPQPGLPAPAHAATPKTGATDLWLEAAFEPAEIYVQAQAIYTLRLYQASDVRELRLEVPAPALGELRPLGEDRVHETTRNGRRYRVTERRFAVFPFASGEFALPGARAVGTVAVPGALPGARAALEIVAPQVALSVLPIPPDAAPDTWLPARALSLAETWTPTAAELHTGEAVQRTIRIEAHGLDAAQLPPPDLRVEGVSVHPAPPRLENRFDGEWNVGIREQSWRIVPSRAGELTVPEVQVHWWDAAAGQPRLAILPARTFSVVGNADLRGAAEVPNAVETKPASTAVAPGEDFDGADLQPAASRIGIRLPPAAAIFAALSASLAWLLRRAWQRDAPWRALRAACRRNDPRATRDALLACDPQGWPIRPPRSLAEFAAHVPDPGARDAIRALDRHLYGMPAERWDGRRLLACIPTLRTKARFRPTSRPGALPPLYPD
ncbi:MAG: hypothetical protein ROZ37_06835 [Aromatoleum sp.]|jgi:hypothetical protein|uniref:BatD family protein n=1 Tax=Aromatoleum sp. TaxID=2307007 RepID=UPI0028944064|nr:hypothetical protein [Aromatoleum sp.]MDT3670032.1 hypothetical protein [Aromatoleum sp.]